MNKQIASTQPKPAPPKVNERRATIEKALDSLPSKALTVTGNSIEEVVSNIFAKGHEMKPGEATRVIGLLPNEKRDMLMRVALLYEKAEEMGKYGVKLQVDLAKKLGITLEALMHFCEPLIADDVARRVSQKRGNDSGLDVPAMTRRDHVEAALNAHGG